MQQRSSKPAGDCRQLSSPVAAANAAAADAKRKAMSDAQRKKAADAASDHRYRWPATWQLSAQDCIEFDERCSKLELPFDDKRMPPLFKSLLPANKSKGKSRHMQTKSAHWLLFLGPIGVFLISGCKSLSVEVKRVLCDLIMWCHRIQAKSFTAAELDDLEQQAPAVFAAVEILYPLRGNTLARHYLAHAIWFIRRFGPLHTCWM